MSKLTRDLQSAVRAFHEGRLSDDYAYLFLDGVSLRVRRAAGRKTKCKNRSQNKTRRWSGVRTTYLNVMRDWIGEREMRTESRRFQWFASIALSCLTTSHFRRQPLSDTGQHVPAQV